MIYKDEIHSHTKCQFSILDRIRILFIGAISVHIIIATENLPGKIRSKSSVHVPKIFNRHKRDSGESEN